MPRSRTRARNRRARLEKMRAEFQEKRNDPQALEGLLRRQAELDHCLWALARPAAGDRPLDEAERAMIAQIDAPRLAGMTPGTVLVAASVREATCHFRHEPNTTSPEVRKAHRRNVIREIIGKEADAKETEKLYMQRTGASRADFFRRKREVESGEFDDHDQA